MRPAFSNVIDTEEYHENSIKEINQGLIDICNERSPRLREEIRNDLLNKKKFHMLRLASIKEDNIKSIHHPYDRAYKELFHFFKFPLIKRRPKVEYFINPKGQKQIMPYTDHIKFQNIELDATYYGGELGDQDRMVWLAVMNNAIRHLEFVQEFGWIPYSLADIAIDANIKVKTRANQALKKLLRTLVEFKSPFGNFMYKGAFHMIDSVGTINVKDLKSQINKTIESKNSVADKFFIEQALRMIDRIKPKTPRLNLISFHRNLMDAIMANQITTVDYWSINKLSDVGEKNLYFYFYDIAQWYKSHTPKKIHILELLALADLKLHIIKRKGKEYPDWGRAINQIETFLNNVKSEGKFFLYWEWVGEKENTWAHVFLDKDARQIPAAPRG